jgi:6-hydroxynicotinate reductase
MRVGCGSATIGMFASQWQGLVDEVVVVDDHITGVVSEHQAGKVIWAGSRPASRSRATGPRRGAISGCPSRALGWGGTRLTDPAGDPGRVEPQEGRAAGAALLMVSTTGEEFAYYELDAALAPAAAVARGIEAHRRLIDENCEPSLCTVLFMGGAGGSLRAGVTKNPVRLTRSVQAGETRLTAGGAETYVWPGGGITFMVDVTRLPKGAFGYVPTPALVAPAGIHHGPRGLPAPSARADRHRGRGLR